MNSYAKVRAPGSKGSKGKNESKQSEISINFKQPFKLTKSSIEQPKLKINNAPSVVHIIQRKSHKKQPQKTDRIQNHIHVIQPSHAKKGWKFSNINNDEDVHSNVGSKSQISSKKQSSNLIRIPKEQPKQLQQVLPHVQPVILDDLQQNLLNNHQKITYQRHLQPVSNILPFQNSINSSQSIKYEESSAHYLDIGDHEQLNQIEIETIVQNYREQQKELYFRNLTKKFEERNQHNDKIGKISSIIKDGNVDVVQIYQLNEQTNNFYDPIKLKRNLQHIKQGSIHYLSSQIIISQIDQNLIHNDNYYGVNEQNLKIIIPYIDEKYNEKNHNNLIVRKLINVQGINDEGMLYQKSIIISQEIQKNEIKILPTHKRNINHNKVLQEEEQRHEQKVQNRFMYSQGIEISSIHQNMKQIKKQYTHTRKLLVLQSIDGKILNQQILIPQQFQQKNDRKISSNLKRQFKIIQYKEQQPKSKSLISHPLQVDINNQDIIIQQINETYPQKNMKQTVKRNLLIINDPLGQNHYQQIIIPQQFQIKHAKISLINQTRHIKHQLSHHEQSYKEEKLNSKVMPLPKENAMDINVDPLCEDYVSRFNKRPLQRKLLLVKDKKNQNIYQSIVIPYAEQINSHKTILKSHKRTMKHLQVAEQQIDDKLSNEKLFQSVVQEYPISKTVEIQQIFENVVSSKQKQYQVRNLKFKERLENKVSSQQIVIPQQYQQKIHQKFSPQGHKRHFNIIQFQDRPIISAIQSDKLNRSSSINDKIEINQIQEEYNQQKKQNKIMRNLLIIKNNNGQIVSQEIIIPQDQQIKSKENNLSYQKRQFKIIQIQNKPIPQEQVQQDYDKNEYKAQKLNSKLPPQRAQYEQSPILINQFQEEIYHNNQKENLGNFKLKRALLLIKNEDGKVFSQEIMIPNEQYQINQQKSPPQTYLRSIKPTFINDQNNVEHQEKPQKISAINQPLNQELNKQLPLPQQIKIDEQNMPQGNKPNNSLHNLHKANEKSLNNPSTLNSSVAQNINLINSFMEQSNAQAEHKLLSRHLEASPQKLYHSAQNGNNEKKFNVYKPDDYFSKSYKAIDIFFSQKPKDNNKIAASLPQSQSHQNDKRLIKACRRPGIKSPQL